MDYGYNERVLFSMCFILLSSHLKPSIDILFMSVRHLFAEFRFIFVKRSCSRRQKAHYVCFLYFIKTQRFVDIVSNSSE